MTKFQREGELGRPLAEIGVFEDYQDVCSSEYGVSRKQNTIHIEERL